MPRRKNPMITMMATLSAMIVAWMTISSNTGIPLTTVAIVIALMAFALI